MSSEPAGQSVQARRFKCDACGGEQLYDAATGKLKCRYCNALKEVPAGDGAVVERDFFEGLAEAPRGLGVEGGARFGVDEKRANESFTRWLGKLWLRPSDLRRLARVQEVAGAIDLSAGFGITQEKMSREQEQRRARDVPGDTHRRLGVDNTFSSVTFKHVLLPVWIAAYRYRNEVYRFLVNGQTGEVVGKAPFSILKITLAIVALAAIAFALYYFFGRHR